MIEAFANGAKSVGGEDKTVRLYELEYKGCVSCLACKLKGSKLTDGWARKDRAAEAI